MAKTNVTDSSDATTPSPPPMSFVDRMAAKCVNFKYATILCCFKVGKRTKISSLEFKIVQLKKKFGIDYLTLVHENAPVENLKEVLEAALDDLNRLHGEIDNCLDEIEGKEEMTNDKLVRTNFGDDSSSANSKTRYLQPPSKILIARDDVNDDAQVVRGNSKKDGRGNSKKGDMEKRPHFDVSKKRKGKSSPSKKKDKPKKVEK